MPIANCCVFPRNRLGFCDGRTAASKRRGTLAGTASCCSLVIVISSIILGIAAIPFIYYCIALYSSWRYFSAADRIPDRSFTPPVSNLKPMRGVDPDAYENLASFCRQDYPEYEMVLCVDEDDEVVMPLCGASPARLPAADYSCSVWLRPDRHQR